METQAQILLGLLCLILALFIWIKSKQKKPKLPPGPMPLPLIGNIHQIGRKPHLSFLEMAQTYGSIFKVKMGTLDALVITDHKLIKEMFNNSASTGRLLANPAANEYSKGPYGVLNSEGNTWNEQRRFTVRTLRNLGFAKTSMESMILDEVYSMLNWFESSDAKPIKGACIFNAPVVNSLWRIVSGERCNWETGKSSLVLEQAENFCKWMSRVATNGLYFAPVLRFIAPEYFGWNQYKEMCSKMHEMFAKSIATHRTTFDSNNLRDFIDHHLEEAVNPKEKSSFHADVAEKNLTAAVMDLFIAGFETTSVTLSWALLYLCYHSNAQNQLQQEIDQVIGSDRDPCLSDRVNMPYTEATIAEILRKSSIVCLGLGHCLLENIDFQGYQLSKGVVIFANIYGVHHNKQTWGDPENFRPERFLNKSGTKFVKNEALIPFSDGKRKCIGEAMARDTIFLFLTSIFKRFEVVPGSSFDKPDFEPEVGFILEPKAFKIRMIPRNRK